MCYPQLKHPFQALTSLCCQPLVLILLIFFGNGSLPIQAQQNSRPDVGKKKNQESLPPNKRKYLQYTESKNGFITLQSLLTKKTDTVIYDGRKSIAVTQIYQMQNFIDRDSSICDPLNLMPLAYYSAINSEGYSEEVSFTAKTIYNKTMFKDSIKTTRPANKLFLNGVIEDDILARLDFKKDKTYTINVVNPGLMFTEYQIRVKIIGKENVDISGFGKITCWRLDVNLGTVNSSTVWYSEKERVQVKKTYLVPDGNLFIRVLLLN